MNYQSPFLWQKLQGDGCFHLRLFSSLFFLYFGFIFLYLVVSVFCTDFLYSKFSVFTWFQTSELPGNNFQSHISISGDILVCKQYNNSCSIVDRNCCCFLWVHIHFQYRLIYIHMACTSPEISQLNYHQNLCLTILPVTGTDIEFFRKNFRVSKKF